METILCDQKYAYGISRGMMLALWLLSLTGCYSLPLRNQILNLPEPELEVLVPTPSYVIEPPDILLIEAVRIVPRSPHRLRPFDVLGISVRGTFDDEPIEGIYYLDEQGEINFGPVYGSVKVGDLTVEQAKQAIETHLSQILTSPQIAVQLAEVRGPAGNLR